jgi:hypothetical protein
VLQYRNQSTASAGTQRCGNITQIGGIAHESLSIVVIHAWLCFPTAHRYDTKNSDSFRNPPIGHLHGKECGLIR